MVEKKAAAETKEEAEETPENESSNGPNTWRVTPSLVWNVEELKPICGSLPKVIWIDLWRPVKTCLISLGMSAPFLVLSVVLAVVFSLIMKELGWTGYCIILAISLLSIYLGQNEDLKKELNLRSKIQLQLIRICDIYNIYDQYRGDIEKGWMGAELLGPSILAFFPFEATLFTVYGIIIFLEQLLNAGCPLKWLGWLLSGTSGVKYVAVTYLAIDRAIALLGTEKNSLSKALGIQRKTGQSVYEPVFLESHFYLLDYYMTKLTSGEILIAEIDEASMAYRAGIRKFDIITQVNGLDNKITTLQSALKRWREENEPLVLEIVTDASDYQKFQKIIFDPPVIH